MKRSGVFIVNTVSAIISAVRYFFVPCRFGTQPGEGWDEHVTPPSYQNVLIEPEFVCNLHSRADATADGTLVTTEVGLSECSFSPGSRG